MNISFLMAILIMAIILVHKNKKTKEQIISDKLIKSMKYCDKLHKKLDSLHHNWYVTYEELKTAKDECIKLGDQIHKEEYDKDFPTSKER